MSEKKTVSSTQKGSAGRVALVAVVTLVVVGGFEAGGWLGRTRGFFDEAFQRWMGEVFERELPGWSGWLAAVVLSILLPALMLHVGCVWQRLVLWVSFFLVMATWAPVLALAGFRPDVLLPCLAVALAGLLAMLCAGCSGRRVDDQASDEAS